MTIAEAKTILGTDGKDSEEIQDCYEEKVFAQIQLLLRDPVVPALVKSRLAKLDNYERAFRILWPIQKQEINSTVRLHELHGITGWRDFFNAYEKNKAALRACLRADAGYRQIKEIIGLLLQNEMIYAQLLVDATQNMPEDNQVKITEPVALILVLQECEALYEQKVIDESLLSLNAVKDNLAIFNLSKEVNRLRKISTDG